MSKTTSSIEKLFNVYEGFLFSFKRSYVNFKEIALVLLIGIHIDANINKK